MTTLVPVAHKQIPAIVNVFVDEGIKDLVQALNGLDERLWTWGSCEGYMGEPAKVLMYYGRIQELDCSEMARCAEKIAGFVREHMDAGYRTRIALEWDGDHMYPFISVEIPADELNAVTRILTEQSASYRKNILRVDRLEN